MMLMSHRKSLISIYHMHTCIHIYRHTHTRTHAHSIYTHIVQAYTYKAYIHTNIHTYIHICVSNDNYLIAVSLYFNEEIIMESIKRISVVSNCIKENTESALMTVTCI